MAISRELDAPTGMWKIARPAAWAGFRTVARTYLMLRRREYRYVFILGHMRSGSTLLAHILASHPDFVSAGETHTAYRAPADLPKLVLNTSELLRRPILRESYIVDQINHEYVSDEVLRSEQLYKCLILIREPGATLRSMMDLLKCDEKKSLDLYTNRLALLTSYGLLLGGRAMLVNYNDLVDRTNETLAALTYFFELDLPLSPNYVTHRMTARIPGFGDPSNNIKSGRIVRTPARDSLAISNETLSAGLAAFCKCRARLHSIVSQAIDQGECRPDEAPKPVVKE
jgi:hypothetical protein